MNLPSNLPYHLPSKLQYDLPSDLPYKVTSKFHIVCGIMVL
nr:MAG TPA: hypothetical protein [Bacteriophage sp.]